MIRFLLRNILLAGFLFFMCGTIAAQTIKTGVLVVGATPAGMAAAIQSAHSGVKTLLIDKGDLSAVTFSDADRAVKAGIFSDFIKRVESAQKYPVTPTQTFSPSFTATIFKAWTDTVKNLTVLKNASLRIIKKDGKTWTGELSDKRTVKADIVLDATEGREVASLASVTPRAEKDSLAGSSLYNSSVYRTGVAEISTGSPFPVTIPLNALLTNTENFVMPGGGSYPVTVLTGQAAGATAAYCSFFKTTTQKLNVRLIQSELVGFGSKLIRLDDISDNDSNAVAIQSVVLTGILKGKVADGKFHFMPDSAVSSEEITLPVKEYYSRSQIWFLDHKASELTLEEVLELIKFTASRGQELNREVEKGWNTSFRLTGKYDLKKIITRREVAVLFNTYLKPFNVSVDIDGTLKK